MADDGAVLEDRLIPDHIRIGVDLQDRKAALRSRLR